MGKSEPVMVIGAIASVVGYAVTQFLPVATEEVAILVTFGLFMLVRSRVWPDASVNEALDAIKVAIRDDSERRE